MHRKWTTETKRSLVEGAEKFQGTRAEYLKEVGVAASQFYRFAKEIRRPTTTPNVIQLLGGAGAPGIEL